MTNGDINRLGNSICEKRGEMSQDELNLLQDYRITFSKPLKNTFNRIIDIADKVDRKAIIAFRLKRIGTIVNKISRFPDMKLSRMGDIGGVRCIVSSDDQVYMVLKLILQDFQISGRLKDYIKEPKEIGYKGIHVYIKDEETNKKIEIQLRTIEHHNWATLVEITDFLYDLRLKELGMKSDEAFSKFHALMSSDKELSREEANLIHEVMDKHGFISKLSTTFRKNNNEIKKRWVNEQGKNKFFLIEALKEEVPNLKSFKNFSDAEDAYFKEYKNNPEAEIVLTFIRRPDFNQLSIAYANYLLTYHTFIRDIKPIIHELVKETVENREYRKFKKIFRTYEDLQASLLLNIIAENIYFVYNRGEKKEIILKSPRKITRRQQIIFQEKIDRKIAETAKEHARLIRDVEASMPNNFIQKFMFKRFLKRHNERLKKTLMRDKIIFD